MNMKYDETYKNMCSWYLDIDGWHVAVHFDQTGANGEPAADMTILLKPGARPLDGAKTQRIIGMTKPEVLRAFADCLVRPPDPQS